MHTLHFAEPSRQKPLQWKTITEQAILSWLCMININMYLWKFWACFFLLFSLALTTDCTCAKCTCLDFQDKNLQICSRLCYQCSHIFPSLQIVLRQYHKNIFRAHIVFVLQMTGTLHYINYYSLNNIIITPPPPPTKQTKWNLSK